MVSFIDKIVKLCESENAVVSSETSEKAEVVASAKCEKEKLPEAVPAVPTEEAV